MQAFFKPTLEKIVIAKLFGVPILVADVLSSGAVFGGLNTRVAVVLLVAGSYLTACCLSRWWERFSTQKNK